MWLEFVIYALIVSNISLEIFVISQVIRIRERRRSTVLPGYIRDFDDTSSPKRKKKDIQTMQILSTVSMLCGGIVMYVDLSQLLSYTGIIIIGLGAVLQILLLKIPKKIPEIPL